MNHKKRTEKESVQTIWQKIKDGLHGLKNVFDSTLQGEHLRHNAYARLRRSSIFSRRKSSSIVDRVMGLLVLWGILIYLLSVAGIWWGSTNIIEDNLRNQAKEWVKKLDELGTPLYATEDQSLFNAIEDHVIRFPELSYLRYYDAKNNQLIAEYKSEKLMDENIPYLKQTQFSQLRLRTDSESPLFIDSASQGLALMQATAPIVIRSIQSDGLMDFDLDEQEEQAEQYTVIGFIELGLDFGIYREQLINNILLGSVLIAALFFIAAFIGRSMIKRALKPLTNLRKPLKKLADGDIDVYVNGEGDEEILAIANALNTTITALKSRDKKLLKLANYDSLTGLLNKHNFHIQLKQELDRVETEMDSSALMFIDLDQFKRINDTLGHAAGDRLLAQVADLLSKRVREEDVLSRFGGDEFTVIARSVSAKDAKAIARSILKSMQDFIFVEGDQSFNIFCSIGVVMIKSNFSMDEIFSQADMACLQAKSKGRNRYHMYDSIKQKEIKKAKDASWSERIDDAFIHNRFSLYYQPIVSLSGEADNYFEALLRMTLENGEIVLPNAFVPAADRSGDSINIDNWVIRNVFMKIIELNEKGEQVSFSINLSARSFEAPDFVRKLKQQLKKFDIDPACVVFEISEDIAVKQIERSRKRIGEIVKLGFRFALDDFGVGFSSFNYLRKLPVHFLKIDNSFITELANDPVDQTMVQSMIQIAKVLDMRTIAKHVEDQKTLKLLKKMGADYGQGFHIGAPEVDVVYKKIEGRYSKIKSNVINFSG